MPRALAWLTAATAALALGSCAPIEDCALQPASCVADSDTAGETETDSDADAAMAIAGVAAGYAATCVALDDGGVRCWGNDEHGQLGRGDAWNFGACVADHSFDCGADPVCCIGDDESPAALSHIDLGDRVVALELAMSGNHACAILEGGRLRCWGDNGRGQLGLGITAERVCGYAGWDIPECQIGDDEPPSAASFVDVGGPVTQLALGQLHTCALLEGGAVRCWGSAGFGALGLGPPWGACDPLDSCAADARCCVGDDELPATVEPVALGPDPTIQIDAGSFLTCALSSKGALRCWGSAGLLGGTPLGYGHTEIIGDDETPAQAGPVPIGQSVRSIGVGGLHVCALLTSGGVRCWGQDYGGSLGYGDSGDLGGTPWTTPELLPDLPLDSARPIASLHGGGTHTCARFDDGGVACWGDNDRGTLGLGSTEDVGDHVHDLAQLVDVDVGGPIEQLSVGGEHSCALLTSGALRCWGYNRDGALGYGGTEPEACKAGCEAGALCCVGDDEPPSALEPVQVL